MYEGLLAETVTISGHGDNQIGAYLARPLGSGPYPGVIVIHHAPGWDEATKEITRKFAAHGYAAICPNLYHRFGPDLAPDDAAAAARAGGWISTEQFLGDAAGALTYVRGLPVSNRKVGTMQSLAAADVNDIGIGRSHGDGADGLRGLVIEDRVPRSAVVVRFPNSSVHRPDVKQIRLAGDAGCGAGAASPKGPDHAPVQILVGVFGNLRPACGSGQKDDEAHQ